METRPGDAAARMVVQQQSRPEGATGKERPLAIFGWNKKKEGEQATGSGNGASAAPAKGEPVQFSPEKAQRFFTHAQTSHDTGGFEYAMTMWLNGLRHDPANMNAIQGFFRSAAAFTQAGNKAATKDIERAVAGQGGPLDRYLQAMLAWALKPLDPALAVKAFQAPAELGLQEPARWIAPKALEVVLREQRPRKEHLVRIVEAANKCEVYDIAVRAGDAALRIDPTDVKLATFVKNLSAQSSISKGGYDQVGQTGGFRANVRDNEQQRKLDEADRLVKTDAVIDRVLEAARADYAARPSDRPTVNKYVKALLERGTPDDEQTAIDVLEKAHAETHEFGFRKSAGEIRMRVGRRELRSLKEAADKAPGDAAAAQVFRDAEARQLSLEIAELEQQIAAYPTDLGIKFELGKRYFVAQRYEDAVGQFQLAKDDGKNRSSVLDFLGRSFAAMGWTDEAVDTFRAAIAGHSDPNDPAGMELRYGLMSALQRRAEEQNDLSNAEEAYKLASAIAIQQINFKDVRARRDAVKALIARLRPPAPGAGA